MKGNAIYPCNKGFTLMEILFVVLVIALIVSFAMPAIRSVRFDIKNARAKAALRKVAEARRSYYEYSRGGNFPNTSFDVNSAMTWSATECVNPAASGVPGSSVSVANASQLFACGFLNWKDFAGLPYRFYICDPNDTHDYCVGNGKKAYVSALALEGSTSRQVGAKYVSPYKMYILEDSMEVYDTAD